MYYPVINFIDKNGNKRQVVSDNGSYPKPFKKIPYIITIYYLEKDGKIEFTTENIIPDILGMFFMIIGIILILFNIINNI